mmetsp:Transcript_8386/g.15819  ORF Transcript_8386/g.15819 Transcript_8386/m.15819 type:complete len:394 (+) Transcript_8386:109-1290(+)
MAKKKAQQQAKKRLQEETQEEAVSKDEQQQQQQQDKQGSYSHYEDYDDDDDELSSEDEGDDLILEGVLVRNPEVESSDDDSSSEDDVNHDESSEDDVEEPVSKKIKGDNQVGKQSDLNQKKNKTNSRRKEKEVEIIPVEFTFHDMNEKYFHGIKNFLLSHPIYASHSSDIADLIIDNISVGTIVSTDDGQDNVYGFASVLNISSHSSNTSIQDFKRVCLDACPEQHKHEMETVLSGTTKRPAGIFMHGRMVNLPLEITHVLHEQLVQDMEWALKHADGGEELRKSLNFGAFVLLAPCQREHGSDDISNYTNGIVYKNFDDEIFAQCAEFVYPLNPSDWRKKNTKKNNNDDKQTMATPSNNNEKDFVQVVVLTRTGHEKAMKELHQLIHGSGSR